MKALRPRKLVFTVKGETDRQRVNFQMKLLSYTEEAKELNLPSEVGP